MGALHELPAAVALLVEVGRHAAAQLDLPAWLREVTTITAPRYRQTRGLIRKNYILSQDRKTAGAAYLWKSRDAAERLYTDEWKKFIVDKYGGQPSVTYFETPVVFDNVAGQIITDE